MKTFQHKKPCPAKKIEKNSSILVATFKKSVFLQPITMPNGVIGNTTDSGSVKSRFEPWLGNKKPPTSRRFFCMPPIKKRDSSEPLFFRSRHYYQWSVTNQLPDVSFVMVPSESIVLMPSSSEKASLLLPSHP